jgi:CheY-like chemotaxis protein
MKLKIFIIEDDADIINLYKLVFEKNDIEIESTSTGKEALEKLVNLAKEKTSKPDIILLDILLPDMPGVSILKEIKKVDELKDIPVIVLSNYNKGQIPNISKEDEQALEKADYLVKVENTPQQLVEYIKEKLNFKQ